MKQIFVVLHHTTQTPPSNLEKLNIQSEGGKLKFLQSALQDRCTFEKERLQHNNGNSKRWWLSFFVGCDYKQTYCVDFIESAINSKEILSSEQTVRLKEEEKERLKQVTQQICDLEACRMKMVYTDKEANQSKQNKALAILRASHFIRGSGAITSDQYLETSSNWVFCNGQGMSYLEKFGHDTRQFERQVLLMALAQAYLDAIEWLSERLAKTSAELIKANSTHSNESQKHIYEQLTHLYQQTATFDACFFYHLPVRHSRVQLVDVWRNIDKQLMLSEFNHELTTQLDNVHYVLDLQIKEASLQADKYRNYVIAIFGILLAVLQVSGFSLFDFTFWEWFTSR